MDKQTILENILKDFELTEYEITKLKSISTTVENYEYQLFNSFFDYVKEYEKFCNRNDYKEILDKYQSEQFNLGQYIWNGLKRAYPFSLNDNFLKLVPYIKPNNDVFNYYLTHTFHTFSNKRKNDKRDLEYEMVESLIMLDKLEIDNKNYIEKVIISIFSRGEIKILELLKSKSLLKFDKTCIQKCIYYGRSAVLQYLYENYESDLIKLIDKDILSMGYMSNISDIWGGMYWANDECDKPIINRENIDHLGVFKLLREISSRYSIEIDFSKKIFLSLYWSHDCKYAITFKDLLKVFNIAFEKNQKGIQNLYQYIEDKKVTMNLVNELFSKDEILDLILCDHSVSLSTASDS